MNQIGLFSEKAEESNGKMSSSKSHLDSKRPQQISISKAIPQNQKWRQCKIIGKNLSIRSYSGGCTFKNKFYLYGGYQILNGMMGDFYSIELEDSQKKFNWEQIQAKGKTPGIRSKHALIGGKSKIYLVAGLSSNVISSDQIFAFDPLTSTWELMKPEGAHLPHIDSFSTVYIEENEEEKIIILCGYDAQKAEYLNSVYEYNITKNKISILFEGSKECSQGKSVLKKEIPSVRSGSAATTDKKLVYLFGGKDSEKRMNDLWVFNLTTFKYQKLSPKGMIPAERNGHSIEYYHGRLYVFGGIHDITWELDDLQIYNIDKNQWITLQQDSPRKIQKKKQEQEKSQKDKNDKKSPKRKNWFETVNSLNHQRNNSPDNSPGRKNYATTYRDEQNLHSPGKMIDEQRKKAFLHKKGEMLKNFEVKKEEKSQYLKLETSSQAMKNSLDVIGNPDPKMKIPEGRITDFGKESVSKFLEPLANNSNLIIGKKPCARDGHNCAVLNNELIIFGGDRHQMSFNDIFKLNLELAEKQLGE